MSKVIKVNELVPFFPHVTLGDGKQDSRLNDCLESEDRCFYPKAFEVFIKVDDIFKFAPEPGSEFTWILFKHSTYSESGKEYRQQSMYIKESPEELKRLIEGGGVMSKELTEKEAGK